MSGLSGFDSEVIGFESVSQNKRPVSSSSSQTNFMETGTGSQTNITKDCGVMTSPESLSTEVVFKDYPPGLNDFLRRVVPSVIDQLAQNDKDFAYNSSDSDEEEVLPTKLLQEIVTKSDVAGTGDSTTQVLDLSFSSAGNCLAVSLGQNQHESWCEHVGLIKIYTVKRSANDKLTHTLDISEKNCVSVVEYHPSISALLAYGTTTGEVVLCNLMNPNDSNMQLSSPSGCHGSKRVSCLQWADASIANLFLTMQISKTGRRRGASDQILISSGSDGTINVWQVNATQKMFENVISYTINGSQKTPPLDITCFDFIRTSPLRPTEQKVPEDVFVVGTAVGRLFLCKIEALQQLAEITDPVYEVLDGHSTCVMNIAFSSLKSGVFVSISMDSELRVYDVNQNAPIKVLCLDVPISCMCWLPNNPSVVVLGLAKVEKEALRMYNVASGRLVPVDGLSGCADVTTIAVNQAGTCRIAAGDCEGHVRVWDLPARRIRAALEDLCL